MKNLFKTMMTVAAFALTMMFGAGAAMACGGNACTPESGGNDYQEGGGFAYGSGSYEADGGAGNYASGHIQERFAGSGSGGSVDVVNEYNFDSCGGECPKDSVRGSGRVTTYQYSDTLVLSDGTHAGTSADGSASGYVQGQAAKYTTGR